MKKLLFIIIGALILCSTLPALAADDNGNQELPSRWDYAYEWANLNLFTWKAESKVKVYDEYATKRAENIALAYNSEKTDQVTELSNRFKKCETEINQITETSKISDKTTLLEILQNGAIERQKILSELRLNLQNEEQKKATATLQEESVNNIKNTIASIKDKDTADKFTEKIVSAWRDPKNTITDNEKETRVYATGTNEGGTIDDGVIIDGGEAKISKDTAGNLKIEYAPGTGPSSVTAGNGKKMWKIQMSDGTVVESYTSGNIVIGKSNGTVSNIVVNTVVGGTSTSANVVVGNSGGTNGVTVVGGKSVVKTGQAGMESSGPANDPSQTVINSINSANSINSLNQTNGDDQGAGQVAPVAPMTQQ